MQGEKIPKTNRLLFCLQQLSTYYFFIATVSTDISLCSDMPERMICSEFSLHVKLQTHSQRKCYHYAALSESYEWIIYLIFDTILSELSENLQQSGFQSHFIISVTTYLVVLTEIYHILYYLAAALACFLKSLMLHENQHPLNHRAYLFYAMLSWVIYIFVMQSSAW